jgi:hypothetical protein
VLCERASLGFLSGHLEVFGGVLVVGVFGVWDLEIELAGCIVIEEGSVDRKVDIMLLQIHLLYILDVDVNIHSLCILNKSAAG